MKRFSTWLMLGLVLGLGLTACNPTGDLGLGDGTPISVPTLGPTVVPPRATPDATSAPPYAEVRATIERLWQANKDKPGAERLAAVTDYLKTLFGKDVRGWQGWVQLVYQNGDGNPYRVALLMDDPFAVGATQPQPADAAPFTEFPLDGLTQAQAQAYHAGEEIAITGIFSGTTQDPWIAPTAVTPVVDATPTPATPAALAHVRITLARTVCYGRCPVYDLSISGDGTVVYNGGGYVQTRGRQEAHISQAQVQELLAFFEKVGYFALNPEYTDYQITDLPYVTTSLTLGDQDYMVRHYRGDRSAPEKLSLLEARIDEIVNTAQWITQGPDDPSQGPSN